MMLSSQGGGPLASRNCPRTASARMNASCTRSSAASSSRQSCCAKRFMRFRCASTRLSNSDSVMVALKRWTSRDGGKVPAFDVYGRVGGPRPSASIERPAIPRSCREQHAVEEDVEHLLRHCVPVLLQRRPEDESHHQTTWRR